MKVNDTMKVNAQVKHFYNLHKKSQINSHILLAYNTKQTSRIAIFSGRELRVPKNDLIAADAYHEQIVNL